MLEPIVVPEANRPKAGAKIPAAPKPAAPAADPKVPMSRRTDATFIEKDA